MKNDRVDFISSYCDRWCERCAFTERCSTYAIQAAIGMCGDFSAGVELAIGTPHPVGETVAERDRSEIIALEISDDDLARARREEQARRTRLGAHPLNKMAATYTARATDWLARNRARLGAAGDQVLQEALQVVGWDAYFIGVKLHRALSGRDRLQSGEDDDATAQSDWNGSAKVALISIERSEAAWRAIAGGACDTLAAALADALAVLRRRVLAEFPRAMAFVRPGFDEPWR